MLHQTGVFLGFVFLTHIQMERRSKRTKKTNCLNHVGAKTLENKTRQDANHKHTVRGKTDKKCISSKLGVGSELIEPTFKAQSMSASSSESSRKKRNA